MTSPAAARSDLPGRLVLWALATELCVSANALTWAGLPYVTEGGSFVLKIHPGTYILCVAFVLDCAGRLRSDRVAWAMLGKDRCLTIFLGSVVTCLAWGLCTTGRGNLIVLIDNFLPAGLCAIILQDAGRSRLRSLRTLLQWGIAANALLALCETALHARLIPLYLNEAEFHPRLEEFRPTALYDHPLTGGVMTMIGLAMPPHKMLARIAYTLLLFAGLLAFGGRAAVVAAFLSVLALEGIETGLLVARRDARAGARIIFSTIMGLAGAAALLLAAACGLGTRLASHLYWDPSAQVRLAQWHLLAHLNSAQVLFGTSRDELHDLLAILWLGYGVDVIENFWLLMFAGLGAIGFCIFLAGFFSLLAWCWCKTSLRGKILLVAVIAVASASNSLGRKSTLLVGLVAATACLSVPGQAAANGATSARRRELLWIS